MSYILINNEHKKRTDLWREMGELVKDEVGDPLGDARLLVGGLTQWSLNLHHRTDQQVVKRIFFKAKTWLK